MFPNRITDLPYAFPYLRVKTQWDRQHLGCNKTLSRIVSVFFCLFLAGTAIIALAAPAPKVESRMLQDFMGLSGQRLDRFLLQNSISTVLNNTKILMIVFMHTG